MNIFCCSRPRRLDEEQKQIFAQASWHFWTVQAPKFVGEYFANIPDRIETVAVQILENIPFCGGFTSKLEDVVEDDEGDWTPERIVNKVLGGDHQEYIDVGYLDFSDSKYGVEKNARHTITTILQKNVEQFLKFKEALEESEVMPEGYQFNIMPLTDEEKDLTRDFLSFILEGNQEVASYLIARSSFSVSNLTKKISIPAIFFFLPPGVLEFAVLHEIGHTRYDKVLGKFFFLHEAIFAGVTTLTAYKMLHWAFDPSSTIEGAAFLVAVEVATHALMFFTSVTSRFDRELYCDDFAERMQGTFEFRNRKFAGVLVPWVLTVSAANPGFPNKERFERLDFSTRAEVADMYTAEPDHPSHMYRMQGRLSDKLRVIEALTHRFITRREISIEGREMPRILLINRAGRE